MKHWCKIIRTKTDDILVERISNHEDGEAIRVSCKFSEVHPVATMGFEEDKHAADKAYTKFGNKEANSFVNDFHKLMSED